MTMTRCCYGCGVRYDATDARCDCGEPLWLETDLDADSPEWPPESDAPGIWRYADLFPLDPPAGATASPPEGVLAAAGDTPLLRTPTLDDFAGARVHVKVEGENPTGSFKDRGSALGVAAALDEGAQAVGTVSHGNMAMSTAAFAAAADIPCLVLVPEDIPEERLAIIGQFDPSIRKVTGDYGTLYERSLEVGTDHGVAFLNSDVPLRTEGQKTTALELCDAFAPDVPDGIVLPVSSGGHASATWKALQELHEAGAIDDRPALYFVQPAACAPIAEAFQRGDDEVSRVDAGETIAYSIANADPPSGNRALEALRDTGGAAVGVTDDELRAAQRALATEAGLTVESSSAVALAGTRKLAAEGTIGSGDDVAVVATGTGLKAASGGVPADAKTVDISAIADELAAFGTSD